MIHTTSSSMHLLMVLPLASSSSSIFLWAAKKHGKGICEGSTPWILLYNMTAPLGTYRQAAQWVVFSKVGILLEVGT